MDYFHARGMSYAEAAEAAAEILTGEPSFYFKEVSMALLDFKYQPAPLDAPRLGLPPKAVLLLPPAEKRRGRLACLAAAYALRSGKEE